MTLDAELERPGLPVADRLLVITGAAVWSADWPRLCAAADAARTRGLPRAELEEALLQAVLVCGFPRVVTAVEQFVAHARGAIAFGADHAQLREVMATVFRGDGARVDAWLARVR